MKDLIQEGRKIQELFRKRFINEDEQEDIKNMLKSSYPDFVKELGDNIKDPKFVEAIKSLADKLPIKLTRITPAVKELRPTQSEVVLNQSLSYPMKDVATVKLYLAGGVVNVAGKSIVTGGGGKFIIDGHHRWSQLFCINPDAKIKAVDIPIKDPMSALKATQLGIAGDTGQLPTTQGGGINLFTINEATLKKYVIDNIQDAVIQAFKSNGKGDTPEKIADYIWGNVKLLKTNSKPIPNAPTRDIMPQVDDTETVANSTPDVTKI